MENTMFVGKWDVLLLLWETLGQVLRCSQKTWCVSRWESQGFPEWPSSHTDLGWSTMGVLLWGSSAWSGCTLQCWTQGESKLWAVRIPGRYTRAGQFDVSFWATSQFGFSGGNKSRFLGMVSAELCSKWKVTFAKCPYTWEPCTQRLPLIFFFLLLCPLF